MSRFAKSVSSAEMGADYLEHAKTKFVEGKGYLEKGRWAYAITSFQETIEFCAKAAFYFVGLDYPKTHAISDEEFAKLHKALPPKLEDIALGRLFFTMEFWSRVRNLAKYGSQIMKVPPKEFFWDSGKHLWLAFMQATHLRFHSSSARRWGLYMMSCLHQRPCRSRPYSRLPSIV